MKQLILAMVGLFLNGQAMANIDASEHHEASHSPSSHAPIHSAGHPEATHSAPPHASPHQTEHHEAAHLPSAHDQSHQTTSHATSPHVQETCPKNCHEAGALLQEIYQVRNKIEEEHQRQNPSYHPKTINPVKMEDYQGSCDKTCPQLAGIQKQLDKYKAELEKLETTAGSHPQTQPVIEQSQKLKGQCTPNCDNEVDLRLEIRQMNIQLEQLKQQHNPAYRMKTFKDIDPSIKIGKMCPAECNNIKLLESRKAQLENALTELKTKQPSCSDKCFDIGERLEKIYKLQVAIENERKRQDPSYKKQGFRPVDIRRFMGTCDLSCPQIIESDRNIQQLEKELEDLQTYHETPDPVLTPKKTESHLDMPSETDDDTLGIENLFEDDSHTDTQPEDKQRFDTPYDADDDTSGVESLLEDDPYADAQPEDDTPSETDDDTSGVESLLKDDPYADAQPEDDTPSETDDDTSGVESLFDDDPYAGAQPEGKHRFDTPYETDDDTSGVESSLDDDPYAGAQPEGKPRFDMPPSYTTDTGAFPETRAIVPYQQPIQPEFDPYTTGDDTARRGAPFTDTPYAGTQPEYRPRFDIPPSYATDTGALPETRAIVPYQQPLQPEFDPYMYDTPPYPQEYSYGMSGESYAPYEGESSVTTTESPEESQTQQPPAATAPTSRGEIFRST